MMALAAKSLKVPLGMIIDVFRIGTWVRRHDVVMVPGMGVLETIPSPAGVAYAILDVPCLRIR